MELLTKWQLNISTFNFVFESLLIVSHNFRSSQVIEGVEVFRELKSVSRSSVGTSIDTTQQSDSHVPQSHVDYITSLAAILHKSHHVTQHFLISSAHDGTIKLWR